MLARRQHGDDDICLSGGRGAAVTVAPALARLFHRRRGKVEAEDFMPGADEIDGHGQAHVAQPMKAILLMEIVSLLDPSHQRGVAFAPVRLAP